MYTPEVIRNFSIISHIDHGKSTLADRMLEITGAVAVDKMQPQYLDSMELERERGITIKMRPVRLKYKNHILNMIDTPGHVDFSYEVSRSLEAVEGAVFLVDAVKGIQAQTLANLELARHLKIIPVINKIDLPEARIEEVTEEVKRLVGDEEIIYISAKNGTNVEAVLDAVVEKVPPPQIKKGNGCRALIFDSKYDSFKGVVAFVRVMEGEIKDNQSFILAATERKGDVKDIGYFLPDMVSQPDLKAGEIGYIATGIKEAGAVRVGDTISTEKQPGLPGYRELTPVVFMSFYPQNADDFDVLKDALSKIQLTDPALLYEPESKEALGRGFRCGFLGSLHAEIISERLKREFDLDLIVTSPSVVYEATLIKGEEIIIRSASDWPDNYKETREPWVEIEVVSPPEYMGGVMEVLGSLRGNHGETRYLGNKMIAVYQAPLRKLISGFHDRLKSATQGYASLNYKIIGYQSARLVKLDILIAQRKEEAFSRIVAEDEAEYEGRKIVSRLKDNLPAQQFSVAIQAAVGGKVIARETIKARRKDVTAPLYGGDVTRKKKLLEKQKKGKKALAQHGKVRVATDVLFKIFKD